MRKLWVEILLLCLIFIYLLPLTALAAGDSPPPAEPYEKVAAKKGNWYATHISYDDEAHLVVGYKGSYISEAEKPELAFALSQKLLLTGIYIPYAGMEAGEVTLTIRDSRGNVYQGFAANQEFTGGIVEGDVDIKAQQAAARGRNTSYAFTPLDNTVLPKGEYTLYLDGEKLPVDAFLVKGYNYAAYQRYLKELQEWAWQSDEPGEAEEAFAGLGNEEIYSIYEQYLEGDGEEGEPAWQKAPRKYVTPAFNLDGEYMIDEIILSTWNNGEGAEPGIIRIMDKNKKAVASYSAQGASQGGAANTLWVAKPGITLPAGAYTIDMGAPEALDFDEKGESVFYVGISVPAVPPASFTGTYKIWLDLYKTHTLMGPVSGKESSFSLEDYELTVLDKGSVIELIGQYEGMPFSQNCTVLEREENQAVAVFNFAADLTKLPYNANIAAKAEVTLKKEPNGRIAISMAGQGFYSRAATKDKGADENTYSLSLRGNRVKKDLPPFVMAAIANNFGAGNIPGPDSPAQAAAGMLFPPLVGLVVSVLQGLLRPKELVSTLSVGEQAMKEANQSFGQGLVSEEEKRAWKTVADALGASGGDPEDAFSVGDNERPGGADYAAPKESAFDGDEGYDGQDYGTEEDLSFGKPDVPEETPDQTSYGQPEQPQTAPEPAAPAEPESMVVQTSARGAQTLIVRDPATGGWVNAETGNPFDLEAHQKNLPKQTKDFDNYIKHNEELEKTGQTAMQQALDEIEKKHQSEFEAIQKEIDQRRREQLAREQESLEWQQEHAQKLSGWGRIIGDSVRNAGDEVVDTAKVLGKEAKEGLAIAGEAAKMTVRDLFIDQKKALANVRESYEGVKDTLGAAKEKVVGTAKEIYNKPWIVVKGVMETGKAVVDIVTDPKKAWEWAKDTVGISDFEKSLDPNLSLIDRLKHTFAGTMKLGVTIGTAGQAGTAIKGSAGKLAGMVDDVLGAGGKRLAVKVPLPKGIKPSLAVKTGPSYATVKRPPNVAGVTQTSRKIIQNTADDFGVQIKARPTTATADKWINSGKAVPKRMDMKAKTLDKLDELLGGPKDSDGLVGYYKPKLPPKEVMKNLSPETQQKLVEKYVDRRREFNNLADKMKKLEASGEYKVVKGRVLNKDGKFITGDVDIYDVVNFDGTPVSPKLKKQVLDHLTQNKGFAVKKGGSNVMHEDVISWTKDGIEYSEKAKEKLIEAAMNENKGVTSYNPMAEPTAEKYVR
ncbi:hypothetical protein [Phosphitispora fastidiosa]|uniref:hypothetical protein n=1 Tax=Phosphitispora fastidiosa TaxID=2837202 RepID=UPI001E5815AA|nr:hypothetical protein [Phosphitispora fastidiosa]MBU7006561.1 putative Zn-dependent protease [Phosphitispora fastidiosa]